jgi:hypothetical protein
MVSDPWKDEKKIINGIPYLKCVHPDYPSHWEPDDFANWLGVEFLCGKCEGSAFQVAATADYETSAKCIKCGFQAVVHSG